MKVLSVLTLQKNKRYRPGEKPGRNGRNHRQGSRLANLAVRRSYCPLPVRIRNALPCVTFTRDQVNATKCRMLRHGNHLEACGSETFAYRGWPPSFGSHFEVHSFRAHDTLARFTLSSHRMHARQRDSRTRGMPLIDIA